MVASLSYIGDIRFKLKGEDKNKIENVVEGNLENFRKLYKKVFKLAPLNQIAEYKDNTIKVDRS